MCDAFIITPEIKRTNDRSAQPYGGEVDAFGLGRRCFSDVFPSDVSFFFGNENFSKIVQRSMSAPIPFFCCSLMSEYKTELKSMLSNTVGVIIDHVSVFMMNTLGDPLSPSLQDPSQNVGQDVSQKVWQTQGDPRSSTVQCKLRTRRLHLRVCH